MRRTLGYLGFLLLLASAFMLGASQLLPRLDAANWANATETVGQVVGIANEDSESTALISFVASNGDPYVFESDTRQSGLKQGQMVTVRYFLTPELRASMKINLAPLQMGFGIAGSVFTAFSFACFIFQMRKSSLQKQLKQYGTRYEATVASIDIKGHIKINGRHPFTITCTMRDPQGIGEKLYKSGWVIKAPSGLKVGGNVPVLVDTYRPSQYCVLVEEASSVSPMP